MTRHRRVLDRSLPTLLTAVVLVGTTPAFAAPSGTAVTPDQQTFLVNKDLGGERWTISAALATGDVDSIISATGNVFRSDGGPPSFVLCQIRSDSTGTLTDAASTFRLACRGTDACQTSARACARDDWRNIADDIQLPAEFFLPPGGLGRPSAGVDTSSGWLDWALDWSARAFGAQMGRTQQESNRGATLSLDRLSYLVSKDVGDQRWAIGLNFVPVAAPGGGSTNQLLSATGNVFFPDGREPSFVFCTVREDSTGTLEDASSEFRFRCSGAGACGATAAECAATAWTPLSDDVRLSASFFLPPGGLPPSVQSDPEIVVIGRTSDPPSIITKDFTIPESAGIAQVTGNACTAGTSCLASRVGSCVDVSGKLVDAGAFGCGCEVEEVPAECITCGSGSTGSCGSTGSFPVGDSGALARGVCLPYSAQSSACIVYAVGSGGSEDNVVEACGGALGASCSGGSCCADDPRDGCDPRAAGGGCSGICVPSQGCEPGAPGCGCFPTAPPAAVCGNGTIEAGEECDRSDAACDADFTCNDSCRCIFDGPSPTPTPESRAPVVTSFTCDGRSACSIAPGVEFTLTFTFSDPDRNASAWTLYLDGEEVNSGSINPPAASGSVSVNYTTALCPRVCCFATDFAYTVVVEDSDGSVSDVAGPVVQTTEESCP